MSTMVKEVEDIIRTLKTKDILYLELKKRIIGGDLEPDTQIVEDMIANEFEVSRTPLREALQRLELEGWVTRQRNGRLKVSSISVDEVKEIFQVRSRLEGLVASEATKRADKKDILELENITKLMISSAEDDRRSDAVRFGMEFHDYLYKLSKNKTAVKMLEQINDHITRYRFISPIRSSDRSLVAAYEHKEIFNYFAAGDYENCGMSIEIHINNSLSSAVKSIEEYLTTRNTEGNVNEQSSKV